MRSFVGIFSAAVLALASQVALGATTASTSAPPTTTSIPPKVIPPAFKHLLTGTIVTNALDPRAYIVSPYGRRLVGATYIGGNWTDPAGKLVANVYPNVGGDTGITDPTGKLHVDTRMAIQWVADGAFGWIHAQGPGIVYQDDDLWIELETDSKIYNSTFTNRFLYGHGSFNGPIWTIQLFGL